MSATSSPAESPIGTPIQPMHNPAQAAHVVVPQAPLGNATNGQFSQVPGMGSKALLAKKFAKTQYVLRLRVSFDELSMKVRFQQPYLRLADG